MTSREREIVVVRTSGNKKELVKPLKCNIENVVYNKDKTVSNRYKYYAYDLKTGLLIHTGISVKDLTLQVNYCVNEVLEARNRKDYQNKIINEVEK